MERENLVRNLVSRLMTVGRPELFDSALVGAFESDIG